VGPLPKLRRYVSIDRRPEHVCQAVTRGQAIEVEETTVTRDACDEIRSALEHLVQAADLGFEFSHPIVGIPRLGPLFLLHGTMLAANAAEVICRAHIHLNHATGSGVSGRREPSAS
jgi:hypothetical protein